MGRAAINTSQQNLSCERFLCLIYANADRTTSEYNDASRPGSNPGISAPSGLVCGGTGRHVVIIKSYRTFVA